ncbi:hypothetical protein ACFOWE_20010 [Planomonospora corallina]|uniref:Uncharacterized protein n=1 Tax=Planomonospora corallina TaxID=1806052 RepID=A0ABV8ICC9_9ACTN
MVPRVRRSGPCLIFKLPRTPGIEETFRKAVRGATRWDEDLQGFVVPVGRSGLTGALLSSINAFVAEHGLHIDPEALAPLGRRPPGDSHPRTEEAVPSNPDLVPGRLNTDLLPPDAWGSDLRSIVSVADWNRLRDTIPSWCEMCMTPRRGERGRIRRPDCHELWAFDDVHHVQKLRRLVALCADCRSVQRIDQAESGGGMMLVLAALCTANDWSHDQAMAEIERVRRIRAEREQTDWDLDLSVLTGAVTIDGFPRLRISAAERSRLAGAVHRERAEP